VIHFPLRHRFRNKLRSSFLRDWVIAFRHRQLRENDVFLASFPKSGTTWMAFMLAQLLWQKGREQTLVDSRYLPGIGNQRYAERQLPNGGRVIRTHEPYRPAYRKSIYIVRDGRDVVVSMYWHVKRAMGMEADFSDYLTYFLSGELNGAGAWHDHVAGWLDSPAFAAGNVQLIRFEDLKRNAAAELEKTATFLGIEYNAEQIADAVDAGSMESMREREKKSPGVVHLEAGERIPVVRKGVVGDWRNYFNQDDLDRFNRYCGPVMTRLGYDVKATVA
jgi:hypothetical protein